MTSEAIFFCCCCSLSGDVCCGVSQRRRRLNASSLESPIYQALLPPWHLCCAALLLLLPPPGSQRKRKRKTQPRLFFSSLRTSSNFGFERVSCPTRRRRAHLRRSGVYTHHLASHLWSWCCRRGAPPHPIPPTAHAPLLPPARSIAHFAGAEPLWLRNRATECSIFVLCVFFLHLKNK